MHQTLEVEAYNMGKGHDRCTREFFAPWKPTHAAQHIEAIYEADWSNPSNPIFTGGVARGTKQVLSELTKYDEALFAKKNIDDSPGGAVEQCLDTLRDPNSRPRSAQPQYQ